MKFPKEVIMRIRGFRVKINVSVDSFEDRKETLKNAKADVDFEFGEILTSPEEFIQLVHGIEKTTCEKLRKRGDYHRYKHDCKGINAKK